MITNMANLVLADGLATPGNHTFVPSPQKDNPMRWVEKPGIPLQNRYCDLSIREPINPADGVYREKVTFQVPLVDVSIPTSPKLVGVNRVSVEFVFHTAASAQDKKDLVAFARNALAVGKTDALGDNIVEGLAAY